MMRVLVFGITENPGGIESVIINYYRNINKERVQFDFLCNTKNQIAYEEELLSLGANIYKICSRNESIFQYRKELNKLFKEHHNEWDAIWVNVCSLANIDYLKIAKKYGIKIRIIHSHNSSNMDSKLRGVLHALNKRKIDKFATDYWSCSEMASKWFFPEKLMKDVIIINNGIDILNYSFSDSKRIDLREKYNLTNDFVIGNIGRLHFQKNQSFILDVFNEYIKLDSNSKLIFVGQGEDEQKLKEITNFYNIQENVIFVGVQKDIQAWLSVFDLFFFPSLFEGLSVSALEAQANGITILASNNIMVDELIINNNFFGMDLNSNTPKEWAYKILEIKNNNNSRLNSSEIEINFNKSKFNIKNEALKLEGYLYGKYK